MKKIFQTSLHNLDFLGFTFHVFFREETHKNDLL